MLDKSAICYAAQDENCCDRQLCADSTGQEIYGGAAGYLEDCRTLIIRVETDNGIEGWGEATQGRPGNTYETLGNHGDHGAALFRAGADRYGLEETGAVINQLHDSLRSSHH